MDALRPLLGRRASRAAFPRGAWERSKDRSLRQLLQGIAVLFADVGDRFGQQREARGVDAGDVRAA